MARWLGHSPATADVRQKVEQPAEGRAAPSQKVARTLSLASKRPYGYGVVVSVAGR